mmetsp:Transcript_5666/g.7334  ORF Transcript_5666/g.7334 Transcript_5666/m.7334 type:complete len:199 (-) Transcript_5666:245-841(-)
MDTISDLVSISSGSTYEDDHSFTANCGSTCCSVDTGDFVQKRNSTVRFSEPLVSVVHKIPKIERELLIIEEEEQDESVEEALAARSVQQMSLMPSIPVVISTMIRKHTPTSSRLLTNESMEQSVQRNNCNILKVTRNISRAESHNAKNSTRLRGYAKKISLLFGKVPVTTTQSRNDDEAGAFPCYDNRGAFPSGPIEI